MRRLVLSLLLLALLAPAALLTVVRATEPPGGTWVRLVSFTPLALPLYAGAAALLLGRALLPGRRLAWLLAALLVGVPLGVHARWYAPQVAGANPPPSAEAEPFRVMTANALRGRVDALGLVSAASTARADVLVVEEITPTALATMESGGLHTAWPYRVGAPEEGTHGNMVFSRLPLGAAVALPTAFQSWDVTVTTPEGPLRLLAVHPFPPTDADRWRADHAAIRATAPGADVIVGDLNATADHAPLRELAGVGLRATTELANAGWQPTWPANGKFRVLGIPLVPAVQIDHVLIGDRLAALSTHTVELEGTDHLAVVAEVAFR